MCRLASGGKSAGTGVGLMLRGVRGRTQAAGGVAVGAGRWPGGQPGRQPTALSRNESPAGRPGTGNRPWGRGGRGAGRGVGGLAGWRPSPQATPATTRSLGPGPLVTRTGPAGGPRRHDLEGLGATRPCRRRRTPRSCPGAKRDGASPSRAAPHFCSRASRTRRPGLAPPPAPCPLWPPRHALATP